MHRSKSLSTATDKAVHPAAMASVAVLVVVGTYLVVSSVCRVVLALGFYVAS